MRFGLFIPQGWRLDLVGIAPEQQWPTMRSLVQHAESGPWESVWVYDHFHTVPKPTAEATHEAWSLMAAFAAVTDRIRIGQMCTCMAYRNPAYLAKVAATVDHVSGGRLEMGIGAGWYENEFKAYGYGFPADRDRLGMLREGVEIMRQAWTTGEVNLAGEHYRVERAILQPLPLQPGGIPLWVAGGGERVTLKIAAQYADYTNFSAGDLEVWQHKVRVLHEHCAALGRDPSEITCTADAMVLVGDSESDVERRISDLEAGLKPLVGDERASREAQRYRDGTGFVGTVPQVIEKLAAAERVGMQYLIAYIPGIAHDRTGLELFEREVIPALS